MYNHRETKRLNHVTTLNNLIYSLLNMPSFIRYAYNRAYLNAIKSGAQDHVAKARASLRISSPQSFFYLAVFLNIRRVVGLLTPDNRIPLFIALVVFFFGNRILVSFLLKKLGVTAVGTKEEVEQRLNAVPSYMEYAYWGYQLLPIVILLGSLWWRFYR